jgi:hypothetical protein
MLVSKLFSFIYDGYTTIAVASTIMGAIMAISLYLLQKTRKNQLDYNL